MNVERIQWCLQALLCAFGGTCALGIVAFVMPWNWMEVVHEWLGLGVLPHKPIVEYLARTTSALCAFYGGLLLLLAADITRYARLIRFQSIGMMALSAIGACLGLRAGMPAWWMIADAASVCVCCGLILWLQKRLAVSAKGARPELT